MAQRHAGPRLLGRQRELEALDQLLDGVRAGARQVLVVRGEAGVGKSALLDHLDRRAAGCRVARAAGVESEMELAFAGLHQLCAPLLGDLAHLPEPQRAALDTAFGLAAGEAPDQFHVGLAVLGLLSEAAGDQPLVCLVDDAQWLDHSSAQALAFAARRLLADPVAVVFAVREPVGAHELAGLPELVVRGLGDHDARSLLESAIPGRIDERVLDRIVAETHGNPLALLELPQGLTPGELAGGFGRPDAQPLASRIEQSFRRQLDALPADTRRLLLVAAAEPLGDVALLWGAAERLGIPPEAATPAEDARLLDLGARVRFRHPLVRAAAYRAGTLPDRREVHRALAEATDPDTDPDRRAWHRAQAAAGPDGDVADELERSAARASARGGRAAAAAFLARATELTPDPARRGERALAAARAEFETAAPDAAEELLAIAATGPLDDLQRAHLARLRAQIAFARRRGRDATPLLLEAARQLTSLDDELARETYFEALATAIFAGRLGGEVGLREVASAARAAPPAAASPRPIDLLLDGVATLLTDGREAGVPAVRRALTPLRRDAPGRPKDIMRLLWLESPIAQEVAVHQLWDDAAWDDLATRAVQLARDTGALAFLPVALMYLAGVRLHAGDFAGASALIEEGDTITEATGYAPVSYAALVLTSWRGDEAQAVRLVDHNVEDASARGEGVVLTLAGYATAVLNNGLGRYEAALLGARQACSSDDLAFTGWSLVELVEAAVRSGVPDEAAAAAERLDERTRAAGTEWALGLRARSLALLSDDREADALYLEAIERLERSRVAVHLARAHLVYGEWLRRQQRRVDARHHLRTAHAMFGRFGAAAFAARTDRELRATGETVRRRTDETRDVLTAQEAQVARLAASGHTNPEIGAQLFISSRTAEYHLRKVFAKLGITSRRQLRGRLAQLERTA